ncbi:MAG: phosphoenolpyruvate--protein phosphotransferase, partial [Solirubrobacteraceae bacterium]
ERAADVLDVGRRVIEALAADRCAGDATRPRADRQPAILLAADLAPADVAAIDPDSTLGVALAHGSPTSHGAILVRALGLPAVTGLGDQLTAIAEGTQLMLDADAATVQIEPAPAQLERAHERQVHAAQRRARAAAHASEPAITLDGVEIEVMANLGAAEQAAGAVAAGADGVGLLRTEFLFAGRPELPSEEEQVEMLRRTAVALAGRPLVVRTLDAGADKPLPALAMAPEENPFLGVRGIRLELAHPELLATQLRAILRVAAEHPVRAMVPMVAALHELLAVRAALDRAREQTGIREPLPLGIMVEIPSAALSARHLAPHADFFSIGTNDLTQYTMAAGRGDARLAPLLAGPQPAVLALVRTTVQAAMQHDRTVAVCGELAGDPAGAVLLAGLGVTELSMAPALIGEVKAALRSISLDGARRAALAALDDEDPVAARSRALALL